MRRLIIILTITSLHRSIGILPLALLALLINPAIAQDQAQKSRPVALAPSPPCGVEEIKPSEGDNKQQRFFAAPPERVKEVLLDAMMAIAADVKKEKRPKEFAFEARRSPMNAGYKGGAAEKIFVSWRPSEESGVQGTQVIVETKKAKIMGRFGQKNWSGAVLDEVTCLLKVLSLNDPRQQPQRADSNSEQGQKEREVVLPANTQVNVRLRHYLGSAGVKDGDSIVFEAADDVLVNGAVVIRKGALSLGKVTSLKGPGSYGREAELRYQIETVLAVDGQSLKLQEDIEGIGKRSGKQVVVPILAAGPIFGAFVKGMPVGVRAGTEFTMFVSSDTKIKLRD